MPEVLKTTNSKDEPSLYKAVGGQEGIKNLVKVFYDLIETTPEGKAVADLHLRGHGIVHAREEQVNYLSGFFGGPNLFAEKWGHSNVRLIHEHMNINHEASDSWLICMDKAMDTLDYSDELKKRLHDNFSKIAKNLINH